MKPISLNQILRCSLFVMVMLSLTISAGQFISYESFDWGAETERQLHSQTAEVDDGILSSLENTGDGAYRYFAKRYGLAAFYILLFLILSRFVQLFDQSGASRKFIRISTVVPLLLAAHQFWWILAEKTLRSTEFYWHQPYDSLARMTFPLDVFCIFLILVSALTVLIGEVVNMRKRISR